MVHRLLLRIACLLLVCFAIGPASGQTLTQAESKRSWKKQWVISLVTLSAATALDSFTSVGKYELNPLIRNSGGTFSTGRGIAIKSAGVATMLTIQALVSRNHPTAYKTSTLLNLGSSAAFATAAAHNLRLQ